MAGVVCLDNIKMQKLCRFAAGRGRESAMVAVRGGFVYFKKSQQQKVDIWRIKQDTFSTICASALPN